MNHRLELRVCVGDSWQPIDDVLADPTELVRLYAEAGPTLRCCDLKGGFFIAVDDVPWADERTVDEFAMTATWVPAVIALLRGESSAGVRAWEESSLTLTRVGQSVELSDVHPSGTVILPPVRVELRSLASDLLRESRKLQTLVDTVQRGLSSRGAEVPSAVMEALPPAFGSQLRTLASILGTAPA